MIKKYKRTRSYSEQARDLCDNHIYAIKKGYISIQDAINNLFDYNGILLVKNRAIKRFGEKRRKGKLIYED